MNYDLSRFSAASFELFVQALAASCVGGRVQVFGAGRDGAREATFEGKVNLNGQSWDGYTVFQAKHRQFPGEPADNAAWLIGEIDAELAKFTDARRNLPRPDFYVLASNVRLSASAADAQGKGEGGVDAVTRHLRARASAIGIADVHLWHQDTICALLDAHPGVRQSYDFWVQPSDVLARLLRDLEGPDEDEVLIPYLQRTLRIARDIKTQDIGQAAGRTVMLEEVFVDLPIESQAQNQRVYSSENERSYLNRLDIADINLGDELDFPRRRLAAAELMARAARRFEPRRTQLESPHRYPRPIGNRIVLLGGPGQGKSTIGQFFAQFCRARLLETLGSAQSPETRATIAAVLDCARIADVPEIGPPRYPFHIELPRFADALRSAERDGRGLSLLTYVTHDINRHGDRAITSTLLKRWLGRLPSVIILDGLDEVPRSGNRDAVIRAIEELLDSVHDVDGDALIFCTSRPQGYAHELDPKLWTHWKLDPLDSAVALHLAERVSNVLVAQESRREEIRMILANASEDPTTSPLMTSPLQVMLLFQLVAAHNNIPKDRWTLFHRHYDTLRDREIAKGGFNGTTIGEYRSQIDRIHYDVGYLLHLRAEVAGGADAYLTDHEFETLVTLQLERDGYEEEATKLAPVIARLATDRLVFLRSQVDGQIAFDVRSLQEFMAAARLTLGAEAKIVERLKRIAGRSHWLHVFKIACSKIFGSNLHEALRDPLVSLLDSLDAGDRDLDDHLLRTGARLAFHLLSDGAAANLPIFRRQLVVRALRLLGAHDDTDIAELADALDFRARSFLEPRLREILNGGDDVAAGKLMQLLAFIARHDATEANGWARDLLLEHWPATPREVLAVFTDPVILPDDALIQAPLRAAQAALAPHEVVRWASDLHEQDDDDGLPFGALACGGFRQWDSAQLLDYNDEPCDVRLSYRAMGSPVEVHAEPSSLAHPGWSALAAAFTFGTEPNIAHAVAFLEAARRQTSELTRTGGMFDWFLQALLRHARRTGDVDATIAALEGGMFGRPGDWHAAETRWTKHGISRADIEAALSGDGEPLFWAKIGAPERLIGSFERAGRSSIDTLHDLQAALPGHDWPLRLLLRYLAWHGSQPELRTVALLEQLNLAEHDTLPLRAYVAALVGVYQRIPTPRLWARLLDALPLSSHIPIEISNLRDELIAAFIDDQSQRSLLPAIAISLARRRSRDNVQPLPEAAFKFADADSPSTRAAVAMLRIAFGRPDALAPETISAWLGDPDNNFNVTLTSLTRGGAGHVGTQAAMAICHEVLLGPRSARQKQCFGRLLDLVEAHLVDLSEAEVATALELPQPLAEKPSEVSFA